MNWQRATFLGVFLSLLVSPVALAQNSVSVTGAGSSGGVRRFEATFDGPLGIPIPAITGAPFSAERTGEQTQTLTDGTHINHTGPSVRLFRDSAGRTRSERSTSMGRQSDPGIVIVEISDPVAGYQYALDTVNRIAHRLKSPAAPPPPASAVVPNPNPNPNPPQFVRESLGSQTMDGLLVDGTRTTTTIPVGMLGNDRPMLSVSESWVSRELKMTILSKHTSPTGDGTSKLIKISRAEPDPALFQAPPDYRMIDEQGPFRIEITQP
jgi:hypothetical protein